MPLRIARAIEAGEMLKSERFRAQWLQLYQECPWATAAQSPGFATSWYEDYKQQYSPLLVCEFSAANTLVGFFPLALGASGQAVLAGAHQAEYKSWLAQPSSGRAFFEASLKLLSQETQIRMLSFRYLPCGAPVERAGISRRLPWICELEPHRRPIVRLGSAAQVSEYVREKTNKTIKSKWNRVKRIGNVRLEQIREVEELAPIFDQLIDWYDSRQEMAHGKRPFQIDGNKKAWHMHLLKAGVIHVTLLKAGQEVLSALFGLSDGKTYSIMMPVFNPEYARYSPIALHHLLLVRELHEEGYSVLDLTPGPDPFKEQFVGEYEEVNVLSIYFRRKEWIKAKVRQRGQAIARGTLSALGIAPSSAGRSLQRVQAFLRARLRLKRPSSHESPHMPETV